jgi:AraC family transcriptional regulator
MMPPECGFSAAVPSGTLELLYGARGDDFLANIAVAVEGRLERGPTSRVLAKGDGWGVADVVCISGPGDRPFEERHTSSSIAIVTAGTFQYRAAAGRVLMTPGALLLGNSGQAFECGHEHGTGDRCLAFWYAPPYFERLARDVGVRGARPHFRVPRVPPLRALSPLLALACARACGSTDVAWEEMGVQLAAQTLRIVHGLSPDPDRAPLSTEARVTRAVRMIERHPDADLTLGRLAREAGLSPYHFLRTFQRLTGLTPHRYVLRWRLREAARRILGEPARILDIALDSGFGDVSNFNRAFRTEFGLSPRAYRRKSGAQ